MQASLDTFQGMLNLDRYARIHIPLTATGIWLTRQLSSEASHRITPKQFEQFLSALPFWKRNTQQSWMFDKARLMSWHPREPTGTLMLEFYRNARELDSADVFTRNLFDVKAEAIGQITMLWSSFVRTAQVLVREGKQREAHWLLDYARTRRPDVIGESATFRLSTRDSVKTAPAEEEGSYTALSGVESMVNGKMVPKIHTDIHNARISVYRSGRFSSATTKSRFAK